MFFIAPPLLLISSFARLVAALLCLSPKMAATSDPNDEGIINFHPMRLISLAAGGENEDYDMVSYVAKDKETGLRHLHVFDCGELSDSVLATIGQAFTLAQVGSSSVSLSCKLREVLTCFFPIKNVGLRLGTGGESKGHRDESAQTWCFMACFYRSYSHLNFLLFCIHNPQLPQGQSQGKQSTIWLLSMLRKLLSHFR